MALIGAQLVGSQSCSTATLPCCLPPPHPLPLLQQITPAPQKAQGKGFVRFVRSLRAAPPTISGGNLASLAAPHRLLGHWQYYHLSPPVTSFPPAPNLWSWCELQIQLIAPLSPSLACRPGSSVPLPGLQVGLQVSAAWTGAVRLSC